MSDAWQQTFTGREFRALDPKSEDVDIVDIAHALSHQCRFGGHCREFYSVAEHSVRASHIVREHGHPLSVQLATLLHDASEAYCVDVPRPIKKHLGGYAEIEAGVQRIIFERFGLDPSLASSDIVHKVDNVMLATEKRDLMTPEPRSWMPLPEPHPRVIQPWTSGTAKANFLALFDDLVRDIGSP